MQKPESHLLTIFGASGDLTRRKLIQALYNLFLKDLLPDKFTIAGVGRKPYTDEVFREQMAAALKAQSGNPAADSPDKLKEFIDCLYYTSLDTSDPASYSVLKEKLVKLGSEREGGGNLIFYLATPPSLYAKVAHSLSGQGLTREETGVDPESRTETYAGLKFYVDNWRWKGVPFYARTGKRLPTRVTEIVIHFQATPHHIFCHTEGSSAHNQLIIRIQPDEGLLLKFGMKVPGAGYNAQNVNMDFHYSSLADVYLPAAYERLLLDCMLGDSTLYARGDAVESAWRFVDPVLRYWEEDPARALYGYPAGTWGPKEADGLFAQEGLAWRYPCRNLADDGQYCEL